MKSPLLCWKKISACGQKKRGRPAKIGQQINCAAMPNTKVPAIRFLLAVLPLHLPCREVRGSRHRPKKWSLRNLVTPVPTTGIMILALVAVPVVNTAAAVGVAARQV